MKFQRGVAGEWGGKAYQDLMNGVQSALASNSWIDKEHLGVTGVSYGGFTTCWLVGHTNQFRAAVAQNAVTDLTMMWSLSDLQSWTEWEFGGRPWEVPAAMRRHSSARSATGTWRHSRCAATARSRTLLIRASRTPR